MTSTGPGPAAERPAIDASRSEEPAVEPSDTGSSGAGRSVTGAVATARELGRTVVDRTLLSNSLRAVFSRLDVPRTVLARLLGALSVAGWVTLVLGIAALLAGRRFGWTELVTAGGALLVAFLAAVAFTVGRHPFEVTVVLSDRRVVVGQRVMAGVTVRNASARPVLPTGVELRVGAGEARFDMPALRPQGDHEEIVVIPTSRRGVIEVGPVSTVRGDPLGLMQRAVRWADVQEVYVHPRTVPLSSSAAGFLHDLEGRPTRDITSADLSFHALREYVPGDDRRYVHWRSTARAGTLMVRVFEETRRSHVVMALGLRRDDYADDEEFEIAVSSLGSLGLQMMREEKDLTAFAGDRVVPAISRGQFLDALTPIEPAGRAPSIVEMAHRITREVERATLAVLVCGPEVSPHDLRAAGAVLPLDTRVIAIRVDLDAETTVRRAGAVTVVTVGSLDELRRGFRKAELR